MKRIAIALMVIALSGCATKPTFLPTFSSSKFACDPVWSTHIPASVANNYINAKLMEKYADAIKKNPSLIDKVFPSPTTLDALGKNGIPIGLGTASIVSAINGNSIASVIGGAVTGGLTTLTGLRSEDRTQDRLDACMPRNAKTMVIITEDAKVFISKEEKPDWSWVDKLELLPQTKGN